MPTDIEKLKALLTEFGVGFEEDSGDEIDEIFCEDGAPKVGGYCGFLTSFSFDKAGKFLVMGAFE